MGLEETLIRERDKIQKEARREGLREGLKEGRQEGEVLSLQKVLLDLMSERFGRLPREVRNRVAQISSPRELRRLTRRILSAKSLEDMRLYT